jgi:hypothetical protein
MVEHTEGYVVVVVDNLAFSDPVEGGHKKVFTRLWGKCGRWRAQTKKKEAKFDILPFAISLPALHLRPRPPKLRFNTGCHTKA